MLRRANQVRRDLEGPRRLPNFPRPPETFLPLSNHLDDDVISNPSDEDNRRYLGYDRPQQFSRPTSSGSGRGRPLPPVPHSRTNSAHFSYHDPALAHSREASGSFNSSGLFPRPGSNHSSAPAPSMPRAESLNPLAKPFVFGARPTAAVSAPTLPTISHARAPSSGKPLNVAAPEFKPGGFSFQPPPGLPQLSFPQPAPAPRPLPTPPVAAEPRASQGREKRIRRGSDASFADDESAEGANDTMSSFKFPPPAGEAKMLRHSAPASPPATAQLNAAAKPFTFSGFSSALTFSQDDSGVSAPLVAQGAALDADISGTETVKQGSSEPTAASELPFPPAAKPKRAPIPLDFKHPVSTNTVPAGLFKSLANGDTEERTRRAVRSRLSSRDVFEHSPRPSLDDMAMPTISQRQPRRLVTDPGVWESWGEEEEYYSPRQPRRRSAPPRRSSLSESEVSVGPLGTSTGIQLQQYQRRLESLLEEKVEGIKKALEEVKNAPAPQGLSSSTESMISEVVTMFRAQLQETAAKGLDDSHVDARGEFDFEMLKDIIEQSQAETRNIIQRDLEELFTSRSPVSEFRKFAEDLSERTMKAIMTATSQVTMHMHTLEKSRGSFATERDNIVRDLLAVLTPHLSALRPEPIDYDGLTTQLTQAVKPHISQLIDLASDKRETAGLIVDRLVPMLSNMYPPQQFDADSIVGRLSTEVRKIVGSLDAHEMKEQVSDLVVERLDSRLAVRDRALNVDAVADKVTDTVRGLLMPLNMLQDSVDSLVQREQSAASPIALDASSIREEITKALADLPAQLRAATEALNSAQSELKSSDRSVRDEESSADMEQVLESMDEVLDEQKKLVAQNNEFSDFCQDILKHINELPEAIVEATKVLQNAHTDLISRDTSKKDAEEIRRLISNNTELQVQLAKARGAHGQVRVEKDTLADRLRAMESERDGLRVKLEDAESSAAQKALELAAANARNAELEAALSQALERIKSSDVSAQGTQDRIAALEKTVSELTQEKHQLQSQVSTPSRICLSWLLIALLGP